MATASNAPLLTRHPEQRTSILEAAAGDVPGASSKTPHTHQVFWMRLDRPVLSIEAPLGTSAQAIVSEIEACARVFAETGESASIDLRCLKAMPEEREVLAKLLGEGDVSAVVDTLGRSVVCETAIPCVWWIRHRNQAGETVGELIEISDVPELIMGDRSTVAQGLEALSAARLFYAPGAFTHPQSNAR